ncbi:hypothetical protein TR51_12835 [Kitasatospora griseola]|uniref:Uncharacterized protein n=1 Tax=Kitasatospora griseola TaxID=2064 RepID=A0A0D0N9Q7_KITGR|nr:hypothetical protein [Kitasatospora griseola]KIQ64960.1 hypothetical protein TR51_12835 [Kitasatospora griseola]
MGIHLVSADVEEWFGGAVAAALDEELARRGLPPQLPPTASAASFEEKVMPPMGAFGALCREALAPEEAAGLLDWTELVPVPFDGVIELAVPSTHGDRTVVFSAHRLLPLAERPAAVLELPEDLRRSDARTMEVSSWFLDVTGEPDALAGRTGRWTRDLPAAFYAAMYLRAAQYCLRQGRPLTYC